MKAIFLAALFFLTPFCLFAFDTEFSFSLLSDISSPLPYAKRWGELSQAEIKGNLELYLYANDKTTFFVNGQVILDPIASLSDSFDLGTGEQHLGLALKEAWLDYNSDYWAIRVGRQISAWGKADLLTVTNVLCPRNFTSFNFLDMSDTYLGIDAVRLTFKNDVYSLDLYWIPVFRKSALPVSGKHYIQKVLSDSDEFPLPEFRNISPDPKFENFEYGLKASAYWKYADVSLYGFYGFDRLPSSFNIDALFGYFNMEYNRSLMFGADASIPLGDVVLRLEGTFFHDATIPITNFDLSNIGIDNIKDLFNDNYEFGYKKREKLVMLAGLDWMPSGWILSAQYYGDLVFGDMGELNRKNYVHIVTLAASKSFFKDTLTLSLAGLLQFEEWNNMLLLNASYNATDALVLSASVYCVNIFSDLGLKTLNELSYWGGATISAKYSF
ncbi:MAG: hypothetical protein IK015_02975 [Treponema sp.]|nr:hypothetical protein [Treponema sp.]